MKKLTALCLFYLLLSCATEQTKPVVHNSAETYSWQADFNKDVVKVLEENKPMPGWVGKVPSVGCTKFSKITVLIFTSFGEGESLERAKQAAVNKSGYYAAEAIKFYADNQIFVTLSKPELNASWIKNDVYQLIKKQIMWIGEKNVEISALESIDEYYRKVNKMHENISYQFFISYGIVYFFTYMAKRDGAISQSCRRCSELQPYPGEYRQKFFSKFEEELDNLDKALQQICK